MTTPQLSHPIRRTISSPAAVAITLSWTVFTLTPSFAVAETPETTVRPGKTSPEAMYRETPGVHTPADSPTTTVPADTAQLLFRPLPARAKVPFGTPGDDRCCGSISKAKPCTNMFRPPSARFPAAQAS